MSNAMIAEPSGGEDFGFDGEMYAEDQEARMIVQRLDELFPDDQSPILADRFFGDVLREADRSTPAYGLCETPVIELSGEIPVTGVSGGAYIRRLVKLQSGEPFTIHHERPDSGFADKTIYLLASMPPSQSVPRPDEVQFGVIRNRNGDHTFINVTTDKSSGTPRARVEPLGPQMRGQVIKVLREATDRPTARPTDRPRLRLLTNND